MRVTHTDLTAGQRLQAETQVSGASHRPYKRRQTVRRPNARNVAVWTVQALVGAVFLVAGAAKLYGVPDMVALFDRIGSGQWLRHTTGAVEFGAAVLLFIPELATVGAALLICTMVAAIALHLIVIGGSALPAALLLGCSLIVAWARRNELPFRSKRRRAF